MARNPLYVDAKLFFTLRALQPKNEKKIIHVITMKYTIDFCIPVFFWLFLRKYYVINYYRTRNA